MAPRTRTAALPSAGGGPRNASARTLLVACVALCADLVQRGRAQIQLLPIEHEVNLINSVAAALYHNKTTTENCVMEPSVLDPEVTFYVIRCSEAIHKVNLTFSGNLFNVSGERLPMRDGKWSHFVQLIAPEAPDMFQLVSCPEGVKQASKDKNCTSMQFDVYRVGGDIASLSMLAVDSDQLMVLTPDFSPFVTKYETIISQGVRFKISATSKEQGTRVGIQFVPDGGKQQGQTGGLGSDNGCELGSRAHDMWDIEGIETINEYTYEVCAIAPDGKHMTKYVLKVTVNPPYSSKLTSIKPGQGFHLTTPFVELNQAYTIEVPSDTKEVSLDVVAKHEEAAIDFLIGTEKVMYWENCDKATGHWCVSECGAHAKCQGNMLWGEKRQCVCSSGYCPKDGHCVKAPSMPRGKASIKVPMHDNDHLKPNEPPIWAITVTIQVTSADKSTKTSYMVTVKQIVSNFCELDNLVIPKSLPCNLTPAFSPDHYDYKCTWWWEHHSVGSFIPSLNFKKGEVNCKGCELRIADPSKSDIAKSHLSIQFQKRDAEHWQKNGQPTKTWSRTFLYGEKHTIPIWVVSADKFTHKIYTITLERDCPWWMKTAFTRTVSTVASRTAMIMAISSAGNVMALAKQLQFLTLTTEIPGVPNIFKDFAKSLKSFNLDLTEFLPDFGLPSLDDFENYKDQIVHKIQAKLKLTNAQIYVQYCFALKEFSREHANAILYWHKEDAAVLINNLRKQGKLVNDTNTTAVRSLLDKHWVAGPDKLSARRLRGQYAEDTTYSGGDGDFVPEMLRMYGGSNSEWARALLGEDGDADGELGPKLRLLEAAAAGAAAGNSTNGTTKDGDPIAPATPIKFHKYADVWYWSEKDWEEFVEKVKDRAKKAEMHLHEESYPMLNCSTSRTMGEIFVGLHWLHEWMVMRAMLHSSTGSFILASILLITLGSLYILYYLNFMRKTQKRLQILEPMQLWIFILDYALINFAKRSSRLMFKESGAISIFGYHPTRLLVVICCSTGLIMYPILFTLAMIVCVYYLTEWEKLVFDEDQSLWMDPSCKEMRITVVPRVIPIPPLPQLFARHLRSIIPVLDEDGDKINFGPDKELQLPPNTVVKVKDGFRATLRGGKGTAFVNKGEYGITLEPPDAPQEANGGAPAGEDDEEGGTIHMNVMGNLVEIPQEFVGRFKVVEYKAAVPYVIIKAPQKAVAEGGLKLEEGMRGAFVEQKEDKRGVVVTFQFHEKDVEFFGDDLRCIIPQVEKKGNKRKRNAVLKKRLLEKQLEAHKKKEELLKRTVNAEHENAKRKAEKKRMHLAAGEEARRSLHEKVLEGLVEDAKAMAWVEGDTERCGMVSFQVKLFATDESSAIEIQTEMKGSKVVLGNIAGKFLKEWNEKNNPKLDKDDEVVEVTGAADDGISAGRKVTHRAPFDSIAESLPKGTAAIRLNSWAKEQREVTLGLRRKGRGKAAASSPPWLWKEGEEDVGWNKIIPLGDLVAGYESAKNRGPNDQLEPEEIFAITQFVRHHMNEEKRLARYHILEVLPRDGYLKPKEPLVDPLKPSAAVSPDPLDPTHMSESWWLDESDEETEQRELVHHTKAGVPYIENEATGERLIYTGNNGRWYHGLLAPAGKASGFLEWRKEPGEGWGEFEKNMEKLKEEAVKGGFFSRANPKNADGVMRYADKWQWLLKDRWEREWMMDEDDEFKVNVPCTKESKFDKRNIPLYDIVSRAMKRLFKDRVPCRIEKRERLEMRKWVWAKLMMVMDVKLRLAWCAAQHPKYYKGQTIEDMARKSFHDLFFELEHATPSPDRLLDGEGNGPPHELMIFTLTKLEDLFDHDDEPWWAKCDPSASGETKVMFDHEMFWMTQDDDKFAKRAAENDLIPQHGYFTSTAFTKHEDENVGFKRYQLQKPDGSETPVAINVQMRHVLPIMRYTNRFKLNVPVDSLELPHMSQWKIVLGDKGKYERFMYGVDRFTVLISIILLNTHQSGFVTAFGFFIAKLVSFLFQLTSTIYSKDDEGREEAENLDDEYVRVKELHLHDDGDEGDAGGGHTPQSTEKAKKPDLPDMSKERLEKLKMVKLRLSDNTYFASLWYAFKKWEVMVPFLQVVTLGFLCYGLAGRMPGPLVAVICIFISSFNMIYMNISTIPLVLESARETIIEQYTNNMRTYNYFRNIVIAWLSGENIFGIAFIRDVKEQKKDIMHASAINVVVPQLGLTFKGKPEVDETLPREEQMAMGMSKKMAYYVHRKENNEDNRPKSIKENFRYEQDVVSSLQVALDLDQLMLRKAIPQVVATIQCVNHSASRLSSPKFDSFLTLFKPEDWDREVDDLNKERVDKMLEGWNDQVAHWLKDTLGAVTSDRTCTANIKKDLKSLLQAECTDDVHRRIRRVRVGSVRLPARKLPKSAGSIFKRCGCGGEDGEIGTADLTDHLACVMVVWESESVAKDFPTMRASGYGKFVKAEKITLQCEVTLRKVPKFVGIVVQKTPEGQVQVIDIKPGSLAFHWNGANPDKDIDKNDIIAQVNDGADSTDPDRIIKALESGEDLRLKIRVKKSKMKEVEVELDNTPDSFGVKIHGLVVESHHEGHPAQPPKLAAPGAPGAAADHPDDADDQGTFVIERIDTYGLLQKWNDEMKRLTLEDAKGLCNIIREGDEVTKVVAKSKGKVDTADIQSGRSKVRRLLISALSDSHEPCEEITLTVQREACAVSEHSGWRIEAQADELPRLKGVPEEMPLKEAKLWAARMEECRGFQFTGVGKQDADIIKPRFFADAKPSDSRYLALDKGEAAERCTSYQVERDPHIEYICTVDSEFDVFIPLHVNRVRLAVWAQMKQTKEEASAAAAASRSFLSSPLLGYRDVSQTDKDTEVVWEELVAFSSEVDIFSPEFECPKDTLKLVEVPVHTRWEQPSEHKLEPFGGDDTVINPEDMDQKDDDDDEGCYGAVTGWAQRKRAQAKDTLIRMLYHVPTAKEIRESRGKVSFLVLEHDDIPEEEDFHAILAVKDILEGDSSLDKNKLDRYIDRWIMLSKVYGVCGYLWVGKEQLELIEKQTETLNALKGSLESLTAQQKVDHVKEKDLRRQLARNEISGTITVKVSGDARQSKDKLSQVVKAELVRLVLDVAGARTEKDLKPPPQVFAAKIRAHEDLEDRLEVSYIASAKDSPKLMSRLRTELENSVKDALAGIKPYGVVIQTWDHRVETEIDKGIRQISDDVKIAKARHQEHSERGVEPAPPFKLAFRRIGFVRRDKKDLDRGEDFREDLLRQLWNAKKQQFTSGKQVLHYVIMSDHLKPGKNWRPDPISPHVAKLVADEFEVTVPAVRVSGGLFGENQVRFMIDKKTEQASPTVVNGRLLYKAVEEEDGSHPLKGYPRFVEQDNMTFDKGSDRSLEFQLTVEEAKEKLSEEPALLAFDYQPISKAPEGTKFKVRFFKADIIENEGISAVRMDKTRLVRKESVWLYWDGHSKWVISPKKGLPPPYGLRGQAGLEAYMWVKAAKALTPDQVGNKPWMLWNGTTNKWKEVPLLVEALLHDGKERKKHELILRAQREKELTDKMRSEEGVLSMVRGTVSNTFAEITSLFDHGHSGKSDPALKDCLVSLSANKVTFAWKDDNIERLASFRRFLLGEFGTYQAAWVYITSTIRMPTSLARRNLALMFARTKASLQQQEDDIKARVERAKAANAAMKALAKWKGDGNDEEFATVSDAIEDKRVINVLESYGWDDREGKFKDDCDLRKERTKDVACTRLNRALDRVKQDQRVVEVNGEFLPQEEQRAIEAAMMERQATEANLAAQKSKGFSAKSKIWSASPFKKSKSSAPGLPADKSVGSIPPLSSMGTATSFKSEAESSVAEVGMTKEVRAQLNDFLQKAGEGLTEDQKRLQRQKGELEKLEKKAQEKKAGKLLPDREAPEERLDKLAALICERLDADGSGTIEVAEINGLYDEDISLDKTTISFLVPLNAVDMDIAMGERVLLEDAMEAVVSGMLFPTARAGDAPPKYEIRGRLDQDLPEEGLSAEEAQSDAVLRLAIVPEATGEAAREAVYAACQALKFDDTMRQKLMAQQNALTCLKPEFKVGQPTRLTRHEPDSLLAKFRDFLLIHPEYKFLETMWAELSDDVEVEMEDFTAAILPRLHKFVDPRHSGKSSEDVAQTIFSELDSQISGGITLGELIPSSGESIEDAGQAMLTFDVPLMRFKEIRIEGHKKTGPESLQSFRFLLNPQFEHSEDWGKLRLALNPDWEPRPNNESIQICMLPSFFDLWRQVIRECDMVQPQEFIRYYDGAYEEHPQLGGVYMRHGEGIQRWVDGRAYKGQWQWHVYEGYGTLYEHYADVDSKDAVPVYEGQWDKGKRHGKGALRWEQDLHDRKGGVVGTLTRKQQVGITKKYTGEFRDDLFHGRGVLELEKAVAQTLRTRSAAAGVARPGTAPLQQVEPTQLLRFEGLFNSDWDETDRLVRDIDPVYGSAYPELREEVQTRNKEKRVIAVKDLALGAISQQDKRMARRNKKGLKGRSLKFLKYFSIDPSSRVQKAGFTLPDLAVAAYSLHSCRRARTDNDKAPANEDDPVEMNPGGFDTKHMKEGVASYADGTHYHGHFKDGRPDGVCKSMIQYELGPDGKSLRKIASYAGGCTKGHRHGVGTFKVYCYDTNGLPVQLFDVKDGKGDAVEKSKGLVYNTKKAIDGDGVLMNSEMGADCKTVAAWSAKTGKVVARWGTQVAGTVVDKFVKLLDEERYLPIEVNPKGFSLGSRTVLHPTDLPTDPNETDLENRLAAQAGIPVTTATPASVVYEGQWQRNKRHGWGAQYVPPNLRDVLGYWWYKGYWENDMRHGMGEMCYGEHGEYLYVGPFSRDMRHSEEQFGKFQFGKVYLKEEPVEPVQCGFSKFTTSSKKSKKKDGGGILGTVGGMIRRKEDPKQDAVTERMTISDAMKKAQKEGKDGFTIRAADKWKFETPTSEEDLMKANQPKITTGVTTTSGWGTAPPAASSVPSPSIVDQQYEVFFWDDDMLDFETSEPADPETTFVRKEDYLLLLHCRFKDDMICAWPDESGRSELAWSHFVLPGQRKGRYYYGQLTKEGQREGLGTLYHEDAASKGGDEFLASFEQGEQYTSPKFPHPVSWNIAEDAFRNSEFDPFIREYVANGSSEKLDLISYHGRWKDNLPHGEGVQHFVGEKGGGTYMGTFRAGCRHGRGVWVTSDGYWKYRPIGQRGVPNWENDEMHGLAIVEDPKHVHENVIYTHGRCQMPFTDMGPPVTGFDNTPGVGKVVAKARKAPKAMAAPSALDRAKKAGGGGPASSSADFATGIVQGAATAAVARRLRSAGSMGSMSSADFDDDPEEVMALVREPTDLNLPEEDVLIEGGTNENEVINGLYFKMTDTFGIPIYRLVRKEVFITTTYTERYLFHDAKSRCWVISNKPSGGIQMAAGMAFAEEKRTHEEEERLALEGGVSHERPGAVPLKWYIWHGPSKTMKNVDEYEEEQKEEKEKKKDSALERFVPPDSALDRLLATRPVDKIKAKSIVGFEVRVEGTSQFGPVPGLMLRHAGVFCGRPVYEGESGGQFLYYIKEATEEEQDHDLHGEAMPPRKLFAGTGAWVLAKELERSMTTEHPRCLAYCKDDAMTPDRIDRKKNKWFVRQDAEKTFAEGVVTLHLEEWNRHDDMMAGLEADQPTMLADATGATTTVSAPTTPAAKAAAAPKAAAK